MSHKPTKEFEPTAEDIKERSRMLKEREERRRRQCEDDLKFDIEEFEKQFVLNSESCRKARRQRWFNDEYESICKFAFFPRHGLQNAFSAQVKQQYKNVKAINNQTCSHRCQHWPCQCFEITKY